MPDLSKASATRPVELGASALTRVGSVESTRLEVETLRVFSDFARFGLGLTERREDPAPKGQQAA